MDTLMEVFYRLLGYVIPVILLVIPFALGRLIARVWVSILILAVLPAGVTPSHDMGALPHLR
jgi:hypothetical protein